LGIVISFSLVCSNVLVVLRTYYWKKIGSLITLMGREKPGNHAMDQNSEAITLRISGLIK
jgi:hypothetical protein